MLARNKIMQGGLLFACVLLLAQGISAQGLGEITLHSNLNEPLDATIELLDVNGLNDDQIIISMGSAEDFERAGFDRNAFLSRIDFAVEMYPLGRGTITLSSEAKVEEPYLNFVLSARWPSGRVLREYTLLIDLPTFSDAQTASENATGTVVAAQGANLPGSRPAPASARAVAETYTVATGDTLWEIAEQTRPSADVSVQQMMIALQRANEDAFVNNNVNRILKGRVLRIPTQQEIGIIDQRAAIAQVTAQNREIGGQILGGNTSTPAQTQRDELSVLSGEQEEASAAENASSDLSATIAALENELMLSEENLDRARIENQELMAQLASLEDQIALLENIIAIEDERIAQLQAELAEQAEATALAMEQAQHAAATLEEAEHDESAQPSGFVAQMLVLLEHNLALIGAALAAVAVVLGFLLVRTSRKSVPAEDVEDFDFSPETRAGEAAEPEAEAIDDEVIEKAASVGFIAKLLAMFKSRPKAQKEELPEESEEVSSEDEAELAADAAETDSDEETAEVEEAEEDSLLADLDIDSELPEVTVDEIDPEGDDEEEDDSDELASSIMDEIDSAAVAIEDDDLDAVLAAIDDEGDSESEQAAEELPEVETVEDELEALSEESIEEVAEVDTGEALAAAPEETPETVEFEEPAAAVTEDDAEPEVAPETKSEDESEDELAAELESVDFNTEAEATETEDEADSAEDDDDSDDDSEVFEFTLRDDTASTEKAKETKEESEDDLESFDFDLNPEPESSALEESDAQEDSLELVDFAADSASAAEDDDLDDLDLDLGNLTFDENDIALEEDEEPLESEPRGAMDECDTKLDLAVAYEAMGDVDGALEILEEVLAEGKPDQIEQASKLKAKWQDA